jgi:DNA repair exonuclease SbcCD ATPase subunit
MTNRKIEALQEASAQKAREAEERVEKALEKMIKQGQKITFSTVAQAANVSTAYLYKQPDLRSRIETLRDQQKQRSKPKQPPPASDNSKTVIIQSLRTENKRLRAEIDELRKINESLTGRLYQLQGSQNLADRLRAENVELKKQLEECRSRYPAAPPTDNPKVTPIDKGKARGITDRIKDELDRLGIKLNSTLTRKIKTADEQTVLNALAALEEAMGSGNVKNASGFLVRAITEGWTKEDSPQQLPQRQPEIYTASPAPDEELVPLDQLKQLFGGTDE